MLRLIALTVLLFAGCQSSPEIYRPNSITGRGAKLPALHKPTSTALQPAVAKSNGASTALSLAKISGPQGLEVSTTETTAIQPANHQEPVPLPDSGTGLTLLPPVSDSSKAMSLSDLEGLALGNNPALAELAARVEAERGNCLQVGLKPNPVIGYSGQQLGSGGTAEQQGVFLGQEFITGNKLKLNRQVAAWQLERAQRDWATLRLRVLTDVRSAYYRVLIAQRRKHVALELIGVAEMAEKIARVLFENEEAGEADPLRAGIETQTAHIELTNAENERVEAWRKLTAAVGMPNMEVQEIAEDIEPPQLKLSWQQALQRLLQESPEMAAAVADTEAARWGIQRARAEVMPDIEVQGVIQGDRATGSTNGNLQVTLPLPVWNRNQGGIRQARAESRAADKAVDRLALNLQSRLAATFRRHQSAENQVRQFEGERGILFSAKRTLELIRIGYEANESTLTDLLNAQKTYFETNLQYLDAQLQLWVATAEIEGFLLTESLAN